MWRWNFSIVTSKPSKSVKTSYDSDIMIASKGGPATNDEESARITKELDEKEETCETGW